MSHSIFLFSLILSTLFYGCATKSQTNIHANHNNNDGNFYNTLVEGKHFSKLNKLEKNNLFVFNSESIHSTIHHQDTDTPGIDCINVFTKNSSSVKIEIDRSSYIKNIVISDINITTGLQQVLSPSEKLELAHTKVYSICLEHDETKNDHAEFMKITKETYHDQESIFISVSQHCPDCKLSELDLSNLDLSGSILYSSDFSYSNLTNSNLSRACLEKTTLRNTNFYNANVKNTTFKNALAVNTVWTDNTRCNFLTSPCF